MNRALSPALGMDQFECRVRAFRYQAGGISYRVATPADEASLRSILRDNSMDSWVQMTLEREPDYFAGENLLGRDAVLLASGAKPPHEIVGMGAWNLRPAHVNGRLEYLGYMGHLRVKAEFRNRIRVLKSSYQALRAFTDGLGPGWSFTSIASENNAALRLLNANLRGMPIYTPQGHYLTLAFSTARRQRGGSAVDMRSAREADVPGLVAFHNARASGWQFAPGLSAQWLLSLDPEKGLALDDFLVWRRNGEICACLAVWDQRGMKQTVARGYRFPVNWLRRPYNVLARLCDRIELPAQGRQLQQAYLAFAAFGTLTDEELHGVVYAALARARQKGAKAAVMGLSADNPLAEKLRRQFRAVTYRSEIETVGWEKQQPGLDGRPVQPEVALL